MFNYKRSLSLFKFLKVNLIFFTKAFICILLFGFFLFFQNCSNQVPGNHTFHIDLDKDVVDFNSQIIRVTEGQIFELKVPTLLLESNANPILWEFLGPNGEVKSLEIVNAHLEQNSDGIGPTYLDEYSHFPEDQGYYRAYQFDGDEKKFLINYKVIVTEVKGLHICSPLNLRGSHEKCQSQIQLCSEQVNSTKVWGYKSKDICLHPYINNFKKSLMTTLEQSNSEKKCLGQQCDSRKNRSCKLNKGEGIEFLNKVTKTYGGCYVNYCERGFRGDRLNTNCLKTCTATTLYQAGDSCVTKGQACEIENGQGILVEEFEHPQYDECLVSYCNKNYFVSSGEKRCVKECLSGEIVKNGICSKGFEICPIVNGIGRKYFKSISKKFGQCKVYTCNQGFNLTTTKSGLKSCQKEASTVNSNSDQVDRGVASTNRRLIPEGLDKTFMSYPGAIEDDARQIMEASGPKAVPVNFNVFNYLTHSRCMPNAPDLSLLRDRSEFVGETDQTNRLFLRNVAGCDDEQCALSRGFNDPIDEIGPYVLKLYGVNFSPFPFRGGRAFANERDALMFVHFLESMPKEILRRWFASRPEALFYSRSARARGFRIGFPNGRSGIAIDHTMAYPDYIKVSYHEMCHDIDSMMGHRARRPSAFNRCGAVATGGHHQNYVECFAEACAAYRLNPWRLLRHNRRMYDYLRDEVYFGIEFTHEDQCMPHMTNQSLPFIF